MCHTTVLKQQQKKQIEKFVENGMPEKLVKKVNFILNRKHRQEIRQKQNEQINLTNEEANKSFSSSSSSEGEENESLELQTATNEKASEVEELSTMTATVTKVAENSVNVEATEKVTEISTTSAASAPVAIETAAPSSGPRTKILTCPFTANKKVVVINPSSEQDSKKQKLANIASFHFKDKTTPLNKATPKAPGEPDDPLAASTQLAKQFFDFLGDQIGKLQSSPISTILTRTTQPAHIIGVTIIVLVLLAVGPDLIENNPQKLETETNIKMKNEMSGNAGSSNKSNGSSSSANILATILYLGAFATHFGSQIWMTFISGLSLYFALPRHIFGQCQKILFPRYFAFTGMLSIIMLILYVKFFFTSWSVITSLQITALALNAVIGLTIRLYFAPPMLVLMQEKYKIEDTVGSGQEVGMIVQGDLSQCPHYQRIHKAFRRSHMIIAIGNMTVLMCTFVLLFSLAINIQMS